VFILGLHARVDPSGEGAAEVLSVGTRCPGHPATGHEAGPGAAERAVPGVDIARTVVGTAGKRHDEDIDTLIMTVILAIDPGSERSAWLIYKPDPLLFGITDNAELLEQLRTGIFDDVDVVVIEQIRSYGMSVGAEIFDTVHWSGRFAEAAHPTPVVQLPRLKVKQAICHDSKAKDQNIRQALIDRFGGTPAIRKGGALYGISKDVWAALGVAVTYADQLEGALGWLSLEKSR
jgi:hypothetical protein